MKKILIVDPLSYSGHVNYNYGIVRAIAAKFDYDIIVNEATAESLQDKGIVQQHFIYVYPDSWNIYNMSKRMSKLSYHILFRLYFIKVLLFARKKANQYDAILFTCIDVYSFAFISWLFNKNCYLVDHGIGGISDNIFYRLGWRLISKKLHIIVLEQFIKDMVVNILPKRNIHVVRHPLPILKQNDSSFRERGSTILLFAPSASNDDIFLHNLCNYKLSDMNVVAKSNSFKFKTEHVTIYNDYLTNDEYNYYLSNSNFILLPYSQSYNYRISAVLFEAMIMGKPVALLSNNTLKYYADIFRGKICLFSSVEEMEDKLKNFIPNEMSSFLNLYSDESLASTFENLFN